MRAKYSIATGGNVALAAATTAKSIVGIVGDAGIGVDLLEWWFSFDGVDATQVPVLVELCYSTFATNAPGTNSTAITPQQVAGRAVTESFAAAKSWSAEPTVLTVLEEFAYDPNKGVYRYKFSLGDEYDSAAAQGFAVRMTIPSGGAAVNARAGMVVARV